MNCWLSYPIHHPWILMTTAVHILSPLLFTLERRGLPSVALPGSVACIVARVQTHDILSLRHSRLQESELQASKFSSATLNHRKRQTVRTKDEGRHGGKKWRAIYASLQIQLNSWFVLKRKRRAQRINLHNLGNHPHHWLSDFYLSCEVSDVVVLVEACRRSALWTQPAQDCDLYSLLGGDSYTGGYTRK
jgi:hypothetical protein